MACLRLRRVHSRDWVRLEILVGGTVLGAPGPWWRPVSILDYGWGENKGPGVGTPVVAVGNISGLLVITNLARTFSGWSDQALTIFVIFG